ncbi:hypothetical protein [Nitrosococcus halophilus]|uniref:hypothetical protein n=1 Tax=Nitrosococcus halophilus TaxID=133539 RepID=UPI001389D8ED|nr:hypothetical protein [Nitrosococcus halophilus]
MIHLRRENLLKQYVSKMLLGAKRERRWQPHTTKKVPGVSIHISPTAAIKEMQRVRNQFLEFEQLLSHHHRIELVYETMINGQSLSNEAAEKICELFQLNPAPMHCDFVKINPNELELMVKNYDELASALRGTEFEQFLD